MARRALDHCANAERTHWSLATQAEAYLMLDDMVKAEELYLSAIGAADSHRAGQSMYSQALLVANRVAGRDGIRLIENVFGVT